MAFDKAAYIGMEIEHSNDTSGRIKEENQKLIDVYSVQNFIRKQQKENKQVRQEAFSKF